MWPGKPVIDSNDHLPLATTYSTLKFPHSKPCNQIRTTRKTTTSNKLPAIQHAKIFPFKTL